MTIVRTLFHRVDPIVAFPGVLAIRWLIRSILLLGLVSACSSTPFIWAGDVPPERAKPEIMDAKIGRGDVINVVVVGQNNLMGPQTVGVDGTVLIPELGNFAVAGLTADEATEAISQKLSRIFKKPDVSVLLLTRFLEVSILGEVRTPGKYLVESGDGVANALAMAGGLTEFGNPSGIYLVRASEKHRIRFRMRDLLEGGDSARSFALRDGDILVVE